VEAPQALEPQGRTSPSVKSPEGAQGVAAEFPAPLWGSEIFGGLHPGFPRLGRVHPGLLPDAPAGAESLFLVGLRPKASLGEGHG